MPLPGPALRYQHFCLPRHGHATAECQDAVAGDPERGRFAVADGASESAYSGEWARLLVEDFVAGSGAAPVWPTWLPPLQARWAEAVRTAPDAPPLPWYLEEPLARGAFATFLGLVVVATPDAANPWSWQAQAVGDSCLFQLRNGELLVSFPLKSAAEFGSTPRLVGSRPGPPGPRARHRGMAYVGRADHDDQLWLMTDALAQWFLKSHEENQQPWTELLPLLLGPEPEASFAVWVAEQRQARRLRDDDVTLLVVCVG
jgi:hypothetical protein